MTDSRAAVISLEKSLRSLGVKMSDVWKSTTTRWNFLERDADKRFEPIVLEKKNVIIYPERKRLENSVNRFVSRLQAFIDTGVWKIRKEIRMTDEDPKLQKLLISFNRECLNIESLAAQADVKRFKSTKLYVDMKEILTKAQDKIQTELKFRETKRAKRKMAFLLD